ncbi:RluA family pseudouridine synthase [Treponema sp. OttesenSCG-928-L16]|nr:RluA family pseudouridine synthase [Treponema sp. OttesenSCG-928-L16]
MALELQSGPDDDGRRIDRVLRKALDTVPLSLIHRLLRTGKVLIDGKKAKASDRVSSGARISISAALDTLRTGDAPGPDRKPGETSLPGPELPPVLWEGDELIILNKPPGMLVHGQNSLETAVRRHLENKTRDSLSFRPGPLHRLDRPTSGVIVFSVSLEGARYFSAALRERSLRKRYIALLDGRLESGGTWDDRLLRDRERGITLDASGELAGSKEASTSFCPLCTSRSYSLVLIEIHSGRTHQIRSHGAINGHPLAGDRKYGGSPLDGGPFLHSYELMFPPDRPFLLPELIRAPLPDLFLSKLALFFGDKAAKSLGEASHECFP